MTAPTDKFNVKTLNDSVKFYLPRVEGYLEIVRGMASRYGGMSLVEFDGYFEGKFEPVKYTKAEIHTNDIDEKCMMNARSEEHTSELQSRQYLVCRLLLEKKNKK